MKILIWSQYFWPENFQINCVARELVNIGADVTVLTGKPNYPEGQIFDGYSSFTIDEDMYAGCKVFRIPMKVRGDGSSKSLALNYLSFIASGYLFAPFVLRNKKYDVVFVYAPSPLLQTLPAIFVAWLKKARLALWVQDLWPESLSATGHVKKRWLLKIVELVVRYIYRYTDRILIQSEQFRNPVSQLVRGVDKIKTFSNTAEDMSLVGGVGGFLNSDKFVGIDNCFSVVFAGNIGRAQSCDTIVAAAELLKDYPKIKFYLVGSGSESVRLRDLIEEKKLDNIIMTGRFPSEDMPTVFSMASALLVSLRRDPAFFATIPNKLQSYMSAGKPIIACLDGGAARLVDQVGCGVSCAAEDAEALAQSVLSLYEKDKNDLEDLGRRARSYYEKYFDPKQRVKELLILFDKTESVASK